MGKVVDALIDGTPLGKLVWDAIGVDAWWEIGVGKYVREALIPIPDDDFGNEAMSQQQMLRSPTEARRSIYGKAMVSGPIVFAAETGKDNEYLHLVIPLAAHQCADVLEIYFDDEVVYQNGSLDTAYSKHARINIHLGTQTAADSDLLAECEHWTASHIGLGITYLYVRLKHDPEFYANGLPNIKALVQGKPLYDPRKDSTVGGSGSHRWDDESSWEWSDNWALCVLDYTRFESGVGALVNEIDLPSYALAANDSDQLVEYDDEGNTEKRYTCNGTFTQSMTPASVLDKLLTAGAGMQTYSSGKYQLFSGVYQGPHLLTIGEADLAGEVEVRPFNARAQLCNAVRGTFVDPDNFYQPTDFAPYESDYYRAQDNGEYIDHDIDLPFTQSAYTAQRLAKLHLELNRAGQQIVAPLNMIGLSVSVGQVVELDLPRLGIKAEYQVMDWQFDFGQPIKVTLRETGPALFDYDKGSYTDRKLTPVLNLPSSKRVPTVTGVLWTPMGDDANWQGLLAWNAPGGNSAYRYRLEVSNGLNVVVYQATIDGTRHHIPKLDAGNYTITLWAVNLFANRSNVPATIAIGADAPPVVTGILVDTGALELTLRPQTAAITATTTEFEVKGGLSSDISNAQFIGQGKEVIWPGRHANTQYFVWARATNNFGTSAWFGPIIAHTTSDKSAIVDLLGNTFDKYTWFAWADDKQGTGFTTDEAIGDGKAYLGQAINKDTATPSGNWQDYTWSKIQTDIPELFTPEELAALEQVASGNMPSGNGTIESSSGAQNKANTAQAQAEANAALDALNKASDAQSAAETYALAKANLAEAQAKAYADGVVSDEEARAIADAQAKADAAKNAAISAAAIDAQAKVNTAQQAAENYALAKANLAETQAKAYADGVVSDEEARAIADAQAKADAAKNAAIAAAAVDAQSKVNAVKVGGKNLVLNTYFHGSVVPGVYQNSIARYLNSSSSTLRRFADHFTEHEVAMYSASGWVKSSVPANLVFDIADQYLGSVNSTTEYQYFKFEGVYIDSEYLNHPSYLGFFDVAAPVNVGVYISDLKIEKGSKATGYTPAPEDQELYARTKANDAQAAAESYALARANLAETQAKAYADGVVSDEEARAIADAQAKADAAKNAAISAAAIDAQAKVNTVQQAAENYAVAKANLAETQAKAYADGVVSDEEARAIADAQAKADAAKNAAISASSAKIDELVVGGYNLIPDSEGFGSSISKYGGSGNPVSIVTNAGIDPDGGNKAARFIGGARFNNVIKKNGVFTFSVFVKRYPGSMTQNVTLDICDVNQQFFNVTDEWQRISVTAKVDNFSGVFHFVDFGFGLPIDVLVYHPQCEEGDKSTSWTPNPNDIKQNTINDVSAGKFTADIGLIITLLANSGLFNTLKAKLASFGGLTAESIASLAISTNHLNAGAVTSDKISASTALIQKLIADLGLFNQLKAQIASFGGLTADELQVNTALVNKLVGSSALFNELQARLAVFGGLTANSIAAGAILGNHIKAGEKITSPIIEGGEMRLVGSSFMKVSAAGAFGPDGLIEWYGPKLLVGGNPDWANLRKNNAITYLAANGDAYFGGSLSAGILKNSVATSDKNKYEAGTAPVSLGPFSTNGRTKVVVVSFDMRSSTRYSSNPGTVSAPILKWQLQKLINGTWTSLTSGTYQGTASVYFENDDPSNTYWQESQSCQGSTTYTDTSTSSADVTYRILVTSYYRNATNGVIERQILSIISTEQ